MDTKETGISSMELAEVNLSVAARWWVDCRDVFSSPPTTLSSILVGIVQKVIKTGACDLLLVKYAINPESHQLLVQYDPEYARIASNPLGKDCQKLLSGNRFESKKETKLFSNYHLWVISFQEGNE